MARNLEAPSYPETNLLLYDNNGDILGGLEIRETSPYISPDMLYRYCQAILGFPAKVQWAIFYLNNNGSTGRLLRQVDHNMVAPGNYVILDQDREPVAVSVTSDRAPRRIYSRSPSSSQIARDRNSLQSYFRNGIRERDRTCAISGRALRTRHEPFGSLQAAHIYPVNRLSEWNAQNYRCWISDTSSQHRIGESGLYSLQNGLLLRADIHQAWDSWSIAIDPDADFKIIMFGEDYDMLGGRRLQGTTINASNPNHRVSPDLLRWHLRMCLLRNMKGNAGTPPWEHDLGPDNMGEILDQADAGERMEAELFSRLGSLVA